MVRFTDDPLVMDTNSWTEEFMATTVWLVATARLTIGVMHSVIWLLLTDDGNSFDNWINKHRIKYIELFTMNFSLEFSIRQHFLKIGYKQGMYFGLISSNKLAICMYIK
jgi:hypothetical protein